MIGRRTPLPILHTGTAYANAKTQKTQTCALTHVQGQTRESTPSRHRLAGYVHAPTRRENANRRAKCHQTAPQPHGLGGWEQKRNNSENILAWANGNGNTLLYTYVCAVSNYRCVKTLSNRAMLSHKPIVIPLHINRYSMPTTLLLTGCTPCCCPCRGVVWA